jgi:predicted dienelactone hydrolase
MGPGRALLFLGFGALLGCGSEPSSNTPAEEAGVDAAVAQIAMPSGELLSFPVDKDGPFKVGHRTREVTYTPPGNTGPRTISVELWYPSLDAEGETAKYISIFSDADVFEGASLAPPSNGKDYPVHVYSHGSSGFAASSPELAHAFASHGWVFVAPNHLGNTLGSPEGKDRPITLYNQRASDVSASLDMLGKLEATDPLAGKARTAHVVLSGHSFGGYTGWAAGGATFDLAAIQAKCDGGAFTKPCRPDDLAAFKAGVADPRIVAVIPMAGGNVDMFSDFDAPKRPYLVMSGTEDPGASGQPMFDKVTTLDLTWLEFVGGCHQLFALGGCAKFEEKLGWSLVNTYALAFSRRYILGDKSARTTAIVTGTESLDAKVTYRHKGELTSPMEP